MKLILLLKKYIFGAEKIKREPYTFTAFYGVFNKNATLVLRTDSHLRSYEVHCSSQRAMLAHDFTNYYHLPSMNIMTIICLHFSNFARNNIRISYVNRFTLSFDPTAVRCPVRHAPDMPTNEKTTAWTYFKYFTFMLTYFNND
jgi:hypothetical protein